MFGVNVFTPQLEIQIFWSWWNPSTLSLIKRSVITNYFLYQIPSVPINSSVIKVIMIGAPDNLANMDNLSNGWYPCSVPGKKQIETRRSYL